MDGYIQDAYTSSDESDHDPLQAYLVGRLSLFLIIRIMVFLRMQTRPLSSAPKQTLMWRVAL